MRLDKRVCLLALAVLIAAPISISFTTTEWLQCSYSVAVADGAGGDPPPISLKRESIIVTSDKTQAEASRLSESRRGIVVRTRLRGNSPKVPTLGFTFGSLFNWIRAPYYTR